VHGLRGGVSDRLRSEWEAAFERYVSMCRTGGTPEQRAWAYARQGDALERLRAVEGWPERMDTIRTEAVK
jgi:hypothetical protein